ncbi:MAG: hypothetical protein R2864_09900 [Syntrophotaleaceae bacterium]
MHGAMRRHRATRREIGIRTIFNILGPLTNPAGADRQVLGVSRKTWSNRWPMCCPVLGCRRFVVRPRWHGRSDPDRSDPGG